MVKESLSIIIPAYNEEHTIYQLLDKIKAISLLENIQKEVIIINDCSTDTTEQVILNYQKNNKDLTIFYLKHNINQGKGAALHTGIREAQGKYLIIQDADLEYDPKEYNALLQPILDGSADVVYGSRFIGENSKRTLIFWHKLANSFLTRLSNFLTGLKLTDMETCHKVFRTEIIQKLNLKEKRFGFEPEVTAKISRIPNIKITEVGISYMRRSYSEGKKITLLDGLWAIFVIFKYNLWARR